MLSVWKLNFSLNFFSCQQDLLRNNPKLSTFPSAIWKVHCPYSQAFGRAAGRREVGRTDRLKPQIQEVTSNWKTTPYHAGDASVKSGTSLNTCPKLCRDTTAHTHAPMCWVSSWAWDIDGVCFAMLSFRRFKHHFSRGCHASFALLHTPHSLHPKPQQQRCFCLCWMHQQDTFPSKFLNSVEWGCRWSFKRPGHGCVTGRVQSSSRMALRIRAFCRRRFSFCLT